MPELTFKESLDKLEISVEQRAIINTEIGILNTNLKSSTDIFKIKINSLILGLERRKVSREQVINVLLDDFENDGIIFGGLKRSLQDSSNDTLRNIGTRTEMEEWEIEKKQRLYAWICMFVNTCLDCLPRHGELHTYEQWENLGLPQSGWSACRHKCQCLLMPKDIAGTKAELKEPIKRAKRIIKSHAKDIGKGSEYINRKLGRVRNVKDSLRKKVRKVL